ncbi:RNA polymerase I-specific transcription initiation factor-domain-containing protein [Hypoxylon trugodes]|uniref:RNA polymerase I-specific transcription initiation factor-domain-containing protein n=1 Tax=Hypoxylon trugodes TaxID=326681 RepID=UPI0021962404|nr:RNA polymerase I-specific transcription initiation factor-domain-containing protein [Hypoxylon trugodes]KAI1392925.1 RNA polymerase I-specific transcription initiation factor-domain-containing protein [Hypoxylon trugodes]
MATTADESAEYIPGVDDDDSEDGSFEELEGDEDADERPNRWRGPKSTWQHFNAEEIDTMAALREIRDRDLAVHLYDAFALRRRALLSEREGGGMEGPVIGKDIDATTGLPVQHDNWLPPQSWTAWPMRVDRVPPPHEPVRSMVHDPDERFTFKKAVRDIPSSVLEEIIGAQILKTAKEKFNARPWATASVSDEDVEEEEEDEDEDEDYEDETDVSASAGSSRRRSRSKGGRSRSRSKSIKPEDMGENEGTDDLDKPLKKPRLKPAVSTDDDLSYNLLRPSVRHILTQLDTTFTILHNVQESMLNYQSDSADSEASDSSHRSRRPSSQAGSRGRGRPSGPSAQTRLRARDASVPLVEDSTMIDGEGKAAVKRKPGRPPKARPRLDGETDKEYAIRIARLRKRRLPVFDDNENPNTASESQPEPETEDPGRDSGNSGDGEETTGPNRGRSIRRKRKFRADNRSTSRTSSISNVGTQRRRSSQQRFGLRDWRDVLGAAALAGFPAPVLDRAARRCADLFGQSMTLHRLVEGPATSSRKTPSGKVTTYVPGMPYPPLLEEEDEEEGAQQRSMILPLRATSAAISENETGPSRRGRRSRSVSRPRSRSGSVGASHVCFFGDCPRAAEGFTRRQNLLRHLKLVHGWTPSESSSGGGEEALLLANEVDSEDEMYGAVHVDGFLRPIRMRQGWRGRDVSVEPRRRRSKYGKEREHGRIKLRDAERAGTDGDDADEEGDMRMGDE